MQVITETELSESDTSTVFGGVSVVLILILYTYAFVGSFFEAKQFHLIHETGFGIMLGIFAGLIFYLVVPSQLATLVSKIKQKDQFQLRNIFLPTTSNHNILRGIQSQQEKIFLEFLLHSTFWSTWDDPVFYIYSSFHGLTQQISYNFQYNLEFITQSDSPDDTFVNLSISEIMIYAATVCASDSVAALTMIKPDQYPKLFSVVFGEGMLNDAVAIIIFSSVGKLTNSQGTEFVFEWYTAFQLLGQFLYQMIGSTLIGLLIGIIATWMFKTFRFLTHSCLIETLLILYMGYMSFNVCYVIQLSGVLSALVCGVVLAHYNFYNMSALGKITSQVTLQSVSMICESFIYIFLGLSVWTLRGVAGKPPIVTSWSFVLAQILIIFLSRALTMIILSGLCVILMGRKKWRLTVWEISIVWYAGLIRGSVAYALILSLQNNGANTTQVQIIQTTVLFLVIITTVILGGLMPCYISTNLRQQASNSEAPSHGFRETLLGNDMGSGESEESKNYKNRFQLWFKKIDSRIIKPCLIFQYQSRKTEIESSKRILKMNNTHFDPSQFGRMSQLQRQSGEMFAQISEKPAIHSSNTLDNRGSQKQLMTKVTFRSSMNSKYTGMHDVDLVMEVPTILEESHENGEQDFSVELESSSGD